MRAGHPRCLLLPSILAVTCFAAFCSGAEGLDAARQFPHSSSELETDLKSLRSDLETYSAVADQGGGLVCLNAIPDSLSAKWAKFAAADREFLLRQTQLLIGGKSVEIQDLKMSALISELSRLSSQVESLRDSIRLLIMALPDWTIPMAESPLLEPSSKGAISPSGEMRCLTRSLLQNLSRNLDKALRSRRQWQAVQREAMGGLSDLKASLASDKSAFHRARVAAAQAREALLGGLDEGNVFSSLASCCRHSLLQRIRTAQADRPQRGSAQDTQSLPRRFPSPLGKRGEAASVSAEDRSLASLLVVEPLEQVLSVANGEVVLSEYVPGFGLTVVVRHGPKDLTVFGHLGASFVGPGQTVSVGQRIGLSGQTGLTQSPALLFAVIRGGRFVDPKRRIIPPSST